MLGSFMFFINAMQAMQTMQDGTAVLFELYTISAIQAGDTGLVDTKMGGSIAAALKAAQNYGSEDVDLSSRDYIARQEKLCTKAGNCVGQEPSIFFANWCDDHGITDVQSVIAAGSMARIYPAKYKGLPVVIKVLHPRVESRVTFAVKIMEMGGELCRKSVGLHNAAEALVPMNEALKKECNLVRERDNLLAIQAALKGSGVKVPNTYQEPSDEHYLVMDHIGGEDLFRFMDPATKSKEDRQKVAELFVRAIFTPLSQGWWYMDPNSGCGKIAKTAGGNLEFTLLDFGSCEHLSLEKSKAMIHFMTTQDAPSFAAFMKAFEYESSDQGHMALLQELFSVYTHPLKQDASVHFTSYHDDVRVHYPDIKKRIMDANVPGPLMSLMILKWFSQISQVLYRLHFEDNPINLRALILECAAHVPS